MRLRGAEAPPGGQGGGGDIRFQPAFSAFASCFQRHRRGTVLVTRALYGPACKI